MRFVFWSSFHRTKSAGEMKTQNMRSDKNQIYGMLRRIFIQSYCMERSHNPKESCASRKKRISKNHSFNSIPVQGNPMLVIMNSSGLRPCSKMCSEHMIDWQYLSLGDLEEIFFSKVNLEVLWCLDV